MPTSMIARARRSAIALAAAATLLVGLVPAVAAADPLAVTTPYPSIAVAPGSKASFDLSITAPVAGNVDLVVAGTPTGWTATIHGGGFVVTGVTAAPGKPATARLDVDIPADTTTTKGTLTIDAKQGGDTAKLVINVAVVVYLLVAKRLFGVRGGAAADAALRAADVGWAALERTAPA